MLFRSFELLFEIIAIEQKLEQRMHEDRQNVTEERLNKLELNELQRNKIEAWELEYWRSKAIDSHFQVPSVPSPLQD